MLPDAWSMEELGAAYPPAAFLSMPRDAKTAARIAQVSAGCGGLRARQGRDGPVACALTSPA